MERKYSAIDSPPDEGGGGSSSKFRVVCSSARSMLAVASLGTLVLGIALGFVIGYYSNLARTAGNLPDGFPKALLEEADPRISGLLLDEVKANNIEQYLRNLTARPHLGGTQQESDTAQLIAALWTLWGFDSVKTVEHDVLLSYPNDGSPSAIVLRAADGSVTFESQPSEKPLRPEENRTDTVPPYNAYSAPCSLKSAKLIYVNYGTDEDFRFLQKNKSISFADAIVIARYGKIFRANKVQLAQEYSASGIILYTDPADSEAPGVTNVYPNTWWLPGSGVQRGTVKVNDGDPLTPGYPSTGSAFRLDERDADLPKICSHPIGYNDARRLLEYMTGDRAPESWQGGLPNVTYRIGPQLANVSIEMNVSTSGRRRNTSTVIGVIRGSVEPDRYVLLGNHHDAWVFGGLDPSSGTAAMLELSRAFTTVMTKAHWRPKRSVVFCAWGSEEFGIVGSNEFVEQFVKPLGLRAVAYINVDILLEGTVFMRVKSTPVMQHAVYAAAKKVNNPNATEVAAGRAYVYDSWLYYQADKDDPSRPQVTVPGSGSDFSPFVQFVGLECADLRFTYSMNFTPITSGYPLYHTLYETMYLVDHLLDPSFNISKAMTQVWAELVRDLSDSLVLPFNVTALAEFVTKNVNSVTGQYKALLSNPAFNDIIGYLTEAVGMLTQAANGLTARAERLNRMNPAEIRLLNDQLMNVQRSFIDPMGLPGRPLLRNVVFAPSQFDSYSGSVFPGLVDALYSIDKDGETPDRIRAVRKQLSVLTYMLESAASTLRATQDFVQ